MESTASTLNCYRQEIAIKTWGSEQASQTILAIHGWLDNANSFDTLAPALVNTLPSCRVIAMDLPGHGLSAHRPHGMHYHLTDYLVDILDVCDALSLQRAVLLGHSLGGVLASLIAVLQPERVSQYICLDAFGLLTSVPALTVQQFSRHITETIQCRQKTKKMYACVDEMIQQRRRNTNLSAAAAKAIVTRDSQEVEHGFTWRHDDRLKIRSPFYLMNEQALAVLQEMKTPGLYIAAKQSYQPYQTAIDERVQLTKGLTFKLVEGDHHFHFEQAERVAEWVRDFIIK